MDFVVGAGAVVGATMLIFAYLTFIWWLDRYEREPFWLVLVTFGFGGIFGTWWAVELGTLPSAVTIAVLGGVGGDLVGAVVLAPVIEEFTKGLVFVGLIYSKHFDNETDGLIYGAAVGLGFACVENLAYFSSASGLDELVGMAIVRTLFTAIVHCVSSATLGMAIGLARHRQSVVGSWGIIALGYLLAISNHAAWNFFAGVAGLEALRDTGLSAALLVTACALVVLAAAVMLGLTQFALKREHDMIKRYLAAEAARGTLPVAHVEIVPYWLRRRKSGWLPAGVAREAYVEAATLLAFRQHQLERAEGARRDRLVADIAEHRAAIAQMLAAA